MKKILATAIVALVPSTAMAADGGMVDGYASISAGYNVEDMGSYTYTYGNFEGSTETYSGEGGKTDGLAVEARGSVAVPLGGNFGAQLDGVLSRTGYKYSGCSDCNTPHFSESSFAAHFYTRKPGRALVGLVLQRSVENWSWGYGQTVYYAGGEGRLSFRRASLGAQVTYAVVDQPSGNKYDGMNAAVSLRVFPKDDFALTVRGGHEFMSSRPGSSSGYNCPDRCFHNTQNGWEVGGAAEYRLKKSHASVFVDFDYRTTRQRYDYRDYPYYYDNNESNYSNFRVMAGVKFNFGGNSLIERDHAGASLDPVRPLTFDTFGDT